MGQDLDQKKLRQMSMSGPNVIFNFTRFDRR